MHNPHRALVHSCIRALFFAAMTTHRIAIIAGDGIGKEVIPAGVAVLEAAARGRGVTLDFTELPWGCEYYLKHQRMMDEDGMARLAAFDAIYLGATPGWLAGLLDTDGRLPVVRAK